MKNISSLSHRGKEPENGTLYIVGTPIGNLNDISPRALNILKNVFIIACEDTRQTKKIMTKFNISNNLISFNKHNSLSKTSQIIENLTNGKSIALVSDAGMPGICDPGEEIINNAKSKGIDVICIPGACAAITALVSSGFPSSRFTFEGFLPKKKTDREKVLREISRSEKTTVLFESPHRLNKLLKELNDYCDCEREIQIFRELTKKHEEHIGTNINTVLSYFKDKEVKGEITIVIKGASRKKNLRIDKIYLKSELNELISAGLSLSSASKYLAKKNNLTKSLVYNLY